MTLHTQNTERHVQQGATGALLGKGTGGMEPSVLSLYSPMPQRQLISSASLRTEVGRADTKPQGVLWLPTLHSSLLNVHIRQNQGRPIQTWLHTVALFS